MSTSTSDDHSSKHLSEVGSLAPAVFCMPLFPRLRFFLGPSWRRRGSRKGAGLLRSSHRSELKDMSRGEALRRPQTNLGQSERTSKLQHGSYSLAERVSVARAGYDCWS